MKKEIEIKVLGQKFIVRSESSEEYIAQVAQFVDQKMTEVMRGSKSVASLNVAILAAMNIADEFLRYKSQKEGSLQQAEKKIKDIIELIELQTWKENGFLDPAMRELENVILEPTRILWELFLTVVRMPVFEVIESGKP